MARPRGLAAKGWGLTAVPRPDPRSSGEGDNRLGRLPFNLAIGSEMPCHAFTDKLLLLARGERIATATQLERLSRPDVVFSDAPPPRLAGVIEERQRALGILPPAVRSPEDGSAPPPDHSPAAAIRAAGRMPFDVEVLAARAIRREAMRQMRDLYEQARAGRPLDLQPARESVRHVVASLRRNEQAFASLLQLKSMDTYTYTHSVNTCVLSVVVAERTGLVHASEIVGLGALLHDIGKTRIPETVLQKPGKLNELEWNMMRQHPIFGLEIVGWPDVQPMVTEAISQHHERLNGSGYPEGLQGGAISPAGRLVAVADVYDAMTSDRPYHRASAAPDAMRWVCQYSGEAFDSQVVIAFVRAIGLFPVGSLVRLTTGELAVVATVNPAAIRRPTVLVVSTSGVTADTKPHLLDLSHGAPAIATREIVGLENPADYGLDTDVYLAMVSELADGILPTISRLA